MSSPISSQTNIYQYPLIWIQFSNLPKCSPTVACSSTHSGESTVRQLCFTTQSLVIPSYNMYKTSLWISSVCSVSVTHLLLIQTFPLAAWMHGVCIAETWTQWLTLPAASVATTLEALALYAICMIWHLIGFSVTEKARVQITPVSPSLLKRGLL